MAEFDTAALDNASSVAAEDVSDLIHNIAPTETPLLTAAGSTDATATLHEWNRDTLDAPTDNVTAEGFDPAAFQGTPPAKLNNACQISHKAIKATGSAEAIKKYGMDSILAYESAKQARVLKNDVDFSMTGTNKIKEPADPRESASLITYLTQRSAAGDNGGPPTGDGSDVAGVGTTRGFAQAFLDSAIQQAWTNGGKPSLIITGPVQKTAMSGFDGIGNGGTNPGDAAATNVGRVDRASQTIYATADVYVSNFGTLYVVPSRHIEPEANIDRNAFLVDPEYVKIAYLRPWQQFDLAKSGDNIRRMMLVEWTLEVCNQDAHAVVTDLGANT